MSTDFASLSHSMRVAGRERGIDLKLGHVQQLLACAFGYQTLGGYQSAPEEPSRIDDGTYLLLDVHALQERAEGLRLDLSEQMLFELVNHAFSSRLPQGGVHTSSADFYDYLHDRLQEAVTNNSTVTNRIGDMNVDGVAEIYTPFDFALADLPSVGDLLTIPVSGFIRMELDVERPYAGHRLDLEINVSMERLGRRLIGNVDLDFETVTRHDPDDGPLPISRARAYAQLLGLSLHLTQELDNVSEEPNTGNSGDGHYGFFIDFADADPEHVVQAIQAKHGKLLFEVGPSFFDNVAQDL